MNSIHIIQNVWEITLLLKSTKNSMKESTFIFPVFFYGIIFVSLKVEDLFCKVTLVNLAPITANYKLGIYFNKITVIKKTFTKGIFNAFVWC